MILKFKDILSDELVRANVVMVFGDKPVFNNIVIDRCKKRCENLYSKEDSDIISEFSVGYRNKPSLNKIEYNEFMSVCYMPSVAGMWYCKVRLRDMTDKEIEWLRRYIKNVSTNAVLVIEETDYKIYSRWLRNRLIEYSKSVHIIQLSFPSNKELITIVGNMFRDRKVMLSDEAIKLFIRKMGGRYDLYIETINELTPRADEDGCVVQKWESETLKGLMVNIQHYSVDMLMTGIIKGTCSNRVNSSIKIVKLLKYLEDEYGLNTLINKLNNEIEILIKFRLWMNEGRIPVGIKFPIDEVKNRLDKNMNKHVFKNRVSMASRLSIEELLFMKSVIEKYAYRSEQCLYIIAIRKSLNKKDINKILGVEVNV